MRCGCPACPVLLAGVVDCALDALDEPNGPEQCRLTCHGCRLTCPPLNAKPELPRQGGMGGGASKSRHWQPLWWRRPCRHPRCRCCCSASAAEARKRENWEFPIHGMYALRIVTAVTISFVTRSPGTAKAGSCRSSEPKSSTAGATRPRAAPWEWSPRSEDFGPDCGAKPACETHLSVLNRLSQRVCAVDMRYILQPHQHTNDDHH